jgi:predicted HTH domain antitoxin
MNMKSITLNIPDDLNLKTIDLPIYLASKMYEDEIVSAGQAAMMVGLSKRAFIEIMGKYGVSVFSSSVDDLLNDIKNA